MNGDQSVAEILLPWARTELTNDIDVHARVNGSWSLNYEQLSTGRFRGEFIMAQLPGVQLIEEHTSLGLRQRGWLGDSVYGFAMSLQASSPVFFNGQKVPANGIMCGRGNQIDILTPARHTLIAMVVERSLLNPLWERMYHRPLASWLEHQLVLESSSAMASALRLRHVQVLQNTLSLALQYPDSSEHRQLRDDILIDWIEALPPFVDTSDIDSRDRRRRMVDMACDLMIGSCDEPLSILQVCSRVGASRRKLNYCFQDVLGISPTHYLRALRLNGVNRALKIPNAATSVQDVATRWGFWHFGQFAKDYKRHFAELPSDTLRLAKKRLGLM